jgi:hypothetical protein
MVDEFSGDFTYNLPLLEVPGPQGSSYPISLSYHSGASPEEEASWVGYGWTLNPGAINRGTRGLPDDYKDQDIVFHNKMPKNWTGTVGAGASFGEIFGIDLKEVGASLSATVSVRYNNYRGFGYNAGVGVSLGKGLVSMGYNVSDGSGSYSLNVNPSALLTWGTFQNGQAAVANLKRYNKVGATRSLSKTLNSGVNLKGSSYGIFSYSDVSKPNIVNQYTGKSFNVSVSGEINPVIVPVGFTLTVFGSYSYQQNLAVRKVKGNGFMYAAEASDDHLMDYHVEQEKDFNKRDVFLGIPFNDADNFIATGEGISGGFRLHNKTAGHFGPRGSKSETDIFNVGGEIGAGWTFGPGADVGKGSHTLTVGNWVDRGSLSSFAKYSDTNEDEAISFRFNNDQGGEWGTNHDDLPFRANVSNGDDVSLPIGKERYNVENIRSGRSSYIGHHTNSEILNGATNETPGFLAYSRNLYLNSLSGVNSANASKIDPNLIGEFAVFNETGGRYIYALPVYAKNEKNLSYSARGLQSVSENFIGYTNTPNESIKVGEEKLSAYASTYLLTEITTPDYVDRGASGEFGPSLDDLGGYTRFNYEKKSSGYHWRAPFKGMIYNKNSHSDPIDDMVSYSEGDKELYYLSSIETKTHVAFFEIEERNDGIEANDRAFDVNAGAGSEKSWRLRKIKLYSIKDCKYIGNKIERDANGSPKKPDDLVKPIKTVYFDYDYSICSGLPNSSDSKGKLTLKRIYTEYNGINRIRINPYEFQYTYPTVSDYASYPSKYRAGGDNDVVTDYVKFTQQNPSYSFFLADAWGNYQAEGDKRFRNMESWVNQRDLINFDPAVWQLKVIKLPSGGEIHIQYEQDDYSYVQDQEAHVMASLIREPSEYGDNGIYYIDPSSIQVTSTDELEALKSMIVDRYVKQGKKIYFKFLYRLVGNDNFKGTDEDLKTCNAEFITGYASVKDCFISGGSIALVLKDERLPTDVCKDFVKAQRLGKVYPEQDCNPSVGMNDPDKPEELVNQLLTLSKGLFVPEYLCHRVDIKHSYFRIPTPRSKKGGGIRVKRLLMFDKGLDGQPVLYGNEYIYKTEKDGRFISSGVATNEPVAIREENILVDFVARKGQGLWSKIVAGRDKEQSEGPIGESILPGASVGYSRVIVRNIHSGKTSPGFSVSDFYTARDYPVTLGNPDREKTMTAIKRTDKNPLPLMVPFYTKIDNKTSAAQGFSFVINSMHGQPRKNASYGGSYTDNTKLSEYVEVSSVTHDYFKPGEKIPVMSSLYEGISLRNPGREVDITFSQRSVKEVSNDINVEVDLQLTVIPLAFVVLVIPYPTAIPSFSYIEGELNTHSTTKVVRYPAIVKKTIIVQDGIQHEEENLAFDAHTGKPVSVRSTDEFKGAYLSQSIPASWVYPEMEGKWKGEGKRIVGSFGYSADVVNLGDDPCTLAEFTRGDLIQLGDDIKALYYVVSKDYLRNSLIVESTTGSVSPSASINQIKIIHTGRTNQLQLQAGAITMHNEQKENMQLPIADKASRYGDKVNGIENNFANALKEATQNLGAGEGQFTLSGTYHHLDMSGFSDRISGCVTDLTDATASNLTFLYVIENSNLTLQLMAFTITCGDNSTKTIKAEGWE